MNKRSTEIGPEIPIGPGTAGPSPANRAAAPSDTLVPPPATEWNPTWPTAAGRPSIPGYEVQDLLGRGGMGVVYRALQKQLKRPVALKMIRSDQNVNPEQVERFRVEAESIALLRHPNVVQIYEIGESAAFRSSRWSCSKGARWRSSVVGADAGSAGRHPDGHAGTDHRRRPRVGIIHRDLKPSNVLFDVDGTAKVAVRLRADTDPGTGTTCGELLIQIDRQ